MDFSGNKYFFRLTKIMNNLVKDLQMLSALKISQIFLIYFSPQIMRLGVQLLLMTFVENFDL